MLLLAWLAYLPGLSGGFLFDDFINLDALGRSGAIDNWPNFWRYLTSGTADPTGRPIALLSFLIDARDWPADPAPFLRTNLILHLINGGLLFALLLQLGRALDRESTRTAPAALLATALWLLHPLLVSTTLYAVQREAMLPASFVLLGLIAYGHGRLAFAHSNGSSGTAWMVCGIGLGTALAVLCKANGVLLPMLAWVLEATVFSSGAARSTLAAQSKLAKVKLLLLIVPSLLVFGYLSHFLLGWDTPLLNRPWTIGQRVLTEPGILLEYLHLLAVPRSVTSGIYNDQFQAVSSLWRPASTLPALLMVAGLILLALRVRSRLPALAAAILFFFSGHLLESSAVPLELYFEHRNYLPAMLLFWPLARALCSGPVVWQLRLLAAALLVAFMAVTTAQRAELWGHPQQLAKLWVLTNPGSSRAQATAASSLIDAGKARAAKQQLSLPWQEKPGDLQIASTYFVAACALPDGISPSDKRAITRTMGAARSDDELLFRWLRSAIEMAMAGTCKGLTLEDVEGWLATAVKNPGLGAFAKAHHDRLLGNIALARKQPAAAFQHYDRELSTKLQPEVAAINAAQLASYGYFEHALALLDRYEALKHDMAPPRRGMPFVHAKVLERQAYWSKEMTWLRLNFSNAIKARADDDTTH